MFTARANRAVTEKRRARPTLEGLEQRMLLYSTLGGQWSQPGRISYSFAPDGTNVAGVPSALYQSMASHGITEAQWKEEIRRAAATWQSVAGLNIAEVPDDGSPFGISGNQQQDSRFGDIRIAATPQPAGVVGAAFLPPPFNGGTLAGDVTLNSNAAWNVDTAVDLQTVALHELGHSLGLDHATYSYAAMYPSYNGIKQTLSTDDVGGIRSIYGQRPQDWLDQYHDNKDPWNAINISSFINTSGKATLGALDITSNQDDDWYYVQAPSNASGIMTLTMQSKNLSSLSPRFQVYNTSLQLIAWTVTPNPGVVYGSTISLQFTGATPGTGVYIKAMGWNGVNSGVNGIGNYAFQADFSGGPVPYAIVTPPNTTVTEQPSQGGGSTNLEVFEASSPLTDHHRLSPTTPGWDEFLASTETRDFGWQRSTTVAPSYGTVAFRDSTSRIFPRHGLMTAWDWSLSAMDAAVADGAVTAIGADDDSSTPDRPGNGRSKWTEAYLSSVLDN